MSDVKKAKEALRRNSTFGGETDIVFDGVTVKTSKQADDETKKAEEDAKKSQQERGKKK